MSKSDGSANGPPDDAQWKREIERAALFGVFGTAEERAEGAPTVSLEELLVRAAGPAMPWQQSWPLERKVRQLEQHGWCVVGGIAEYPVTLTRRRFRVIGTEMLITVELNEAGAAVVDGVGWVVCDEDRDLFRWCTWP